MWGSSIEARTSRRSSTTPLVDSSLADCLHIVDRLAAACVLPLAIWLILNGLDDLIPLFLWLKSIAVPKKSTRAAEPRSPHTVDKRIAIFVPLWHEHRVIGRMLERNRAAIRYSNYDFFVGAYPNDQPTVDAVSAMAERYPNVHLALCPHDGPTSKPDCLNWIYQRMLLYEEQHSTRYDIIATHDAEDVIHPESLKTLNLYADEYDMVQIPVIPLTTAFWEFTHGLYCDDFAESQTKDMPARQAMRGFIPSCGVGTGYSRETIELLAATESNRIFDPTCLTEDYENGFRLGIRGCRQVFVPLKRKDGSWIATREYFPRNIGSAIRQRTRWITGIVLQGWARNGWTCSPRYRYWLWRDRKCLVGNPASLFANLLSYYGACTWMWSKAVRQPWGIAEHLDRGTVRFLIIATLTLQCVHLCVRILCSARLYGLRFALGAPLRAVWGNWINGRASISAILTYALARFSGKSLAWVKTEHSYPSRAALLEPHRLLGQILVGSGYITPEQLAHALQWKGSARIGEFLISTGAIDSEDLCEALALQQNLPFGRVEPGSIPTNVARSLPIEIVTSCRVAPFRAFSGDLFLASPDLPTEQLHRDLRKFTALDIRFHLVTEANFRELQEQLLQTGTAGTAPPPSTSSPSATASA